ncbi:MAG TPA: hypothetical protein VHW66_18985 [Stellaceae bacterium]|jgi:hypothetical protein|nr:hypothetical protein [Stellaceae bacterium]
MQLAFGAGALWGNRTDTTGSGIGPDQFGILQDVEIDWDWQTKELWGQYQFPLDIARGQGKITGKAKFARIFGAIYGDLFFGQTPASGQIQVSENEAGSVPASSTYTITPANAASYLDDLGVYYASGATAGTRFSRVSTGPTAGQYSVNMSTGVYTFAAADASAAVQISYLYTGTGGKKLVLTNQFMGFTPTFKATFYTTKTTQGTPAGLSLVLNACTATKLSLPTKIDDYEIQEFDFSAFADATGTIGTLSTNE